MAKRRPAVGYLRVSTDEQREGFGLAVQDDAIRAYCAANGLRLTGVFADEGLSGSNGLDTRAALADALEALRDGTAAVLVVYRLDRLSRDAILQESLLRDVWTHGGEVVSTSAAESAYLSDEPDDPSRALIRQILSAVGEYEAAMIRLRMRAGRRRKAEAGGYIGGPTPYGQRASDGVLVADEAEAEIVAMVTRLRASGASYRAICSALTDAGLSPRGGGTWQPMVVRRIALRAG